MTAPTSDKIARALFGKTRRNVLGLLFGRPNEAFYLRQIVRATGAGIGAVQRELAKLTKAGLITRTPRGRQVYFKADPESPVFDELRGLIDKTSGLADVVRSALIELEEDGKIALAFIYGSVATADHTSASDIDLMIIGDVQLSEIIPPLQPAQDLLDREINPTIYRVGELREKLSAREHFLSRTFRGPKIMLIGRENDLEELAGPAMAD